MLGLHQKCLVVVKLVMGVHHVNSKVTKQSSRMVELVYELHHVNPKDDQRKFQSSEYVLGLYHRSLRVVKLMVGFYHGSAKVTKGSSAMVESMCRLYHIGPEDDQRKFQNSGAYAWALL